MNATIPKSHWVPRPARRPRRSGRRAGRRRGSQSCVCRGQRGQRCTAPPWRPPALLNPTAAAAPLRRQHGGGAGQEADRGGRAAHQSSASGSSSARTASSRSRGALGARCTRTASSARPAGRTPSLPLITPLSRTAPRSCSRAPRRAPAVCHGGTKWEPKVEVRRGHNFRDLPYLNSRAPRAKRFLKEIDPRPPSARADALIPFSGPSIGCC
jgi:hypothetical protein